jgi:uncharacterized protein (UPF0261 family)
MHVYLLATLDTKGAEAQWLCDELRRLEVSVKLIDTGCLGMPQVEADVPRAEVYAAAGVALHELQERADRGEAIAAAARGAAEFLRRLHEQGDVAGVLGIGGSAGTTVGTAAMRALPLGVPKLMVSTLASGQVRHYVGDKDILMLNAVTDIAGINRVSRLVLGQAAHAMAGMVRFATRSSSEHDRPLIAATMFGVTTPCVNRAREILEGAGYEVLVFHATGSGGQAMESLLADGLIAGVLDITTTELADELVGGVLSAGPDRLTAAARCGVPQVVSVGALDMVNFHAPETVPAKFDGRKFYRHNASVTLMRTTSQENELLGREIGRKISQARGPAAVLFPLQGVSAIDRAGQPFDDPTARHSLLTALRGHLSGVSLIELDHHINDPAFAEAAAEKLLSLIERER